MKNGSMIDPKIAEVMAMEISRHRKKSVPKLLVNGQLVFDHKKDEGEGPTEFAGFDTLRSDDVDLIETWSRRAVERKSADGKSYISFVTTYWIRSKGRPVVDKPTVLPGRARNIPDWGMDQSAITQLLAYRYWKRSYESRMNHMRDAIRSYWLDLPEGGIPQTSRKALDRFRDDGNKLLVHGQNEWHLNEIAFQQKWLEAVHTGDVPPEDQHLLSFSSLAADLWKSEARWGVVNWNGFWSVGVVVDETDELLCTVAEMRWSRETTDPLIRRTMLFHPLVYPALVLKFSKQSS